MKIVTIGRGNVGGGLAALWRKAGHEVTVFGRDGGDASDADVVLVVVTGGQATAHAPKQADLVPLSASNAYTVKPRPVVRTVPSAVCRAVSAGPPPVIAWARGALDGVGPYGPALGPPEVPHAAATVAAAAPSAASSRG